MILYFQQLEKSDVYTWHLNYAYLHACCSKGRIYKREGATRFAGILLRTADGLAISATLQHQILTQIKVDRL